MSAFIDTSGFYALLVRSEEGYERVLRAFRELAEGGRTLWTTSYLLVETAVCLILGVGLATACQAAPVVIMVGESTTFGTTGPSDNPGISPTNPPAVLQYLLTQVPGCAYANLPVRNWAIPSTITQNWFDARPDYFCTRYLDDFPLLGYACPNNLPLAYAVKPLAAQNGDDITIVLVHAQGTNDGNVRGLSTPEKTVERISRWASILDPVPVMISPPFNRERIRRGELITMWGRYPVHFVKRVRRLELRRGLITGPDWGSLMPKPPLFDSLHLTDGGYAAAAAFWLDKLCPGGG